MGKTHGLFCKGTSPGIWDGSGDGDHSMPVSGMKMNTWVMLVQRCTEMPKSIWATARHGIWNRHCQQLQAGYIEVFLEYYHWVILGGRYRVLWQHAAEEGCWIWKHWSSVTLWNVLLLGDTQGDYNACQKAGVPFCLRILFGTVDAQVPQVESWSSYGSNEIFIVLQFTYHIVVKPPLGKIPAGACFFTQ